jgi:hypothetical protein
MVEEDREGILMLRSILSALILITVFGLLTYLALAGGGKSELTWNVVEAKSLGQEVGGRQTTGNFVLVLLVIANTGDVPVEFPGFNLLSVDKHTIYPHLGNLNLTDQCAPGTIEVNETLVCGYVFELRQPVPLGLVAIDGYGERLVILQK